MAKKRSKRTGRTLNLGNAIVGGNAIVQMLEPFLTRGIIAAAQSSIQSRDPAAFLAVIKEGGREAVSLANIMQTLGPAVALKVARAVVGGSKTFSLRGRGRITGVKAF